MDHISRQERCHYISVAMELVSVALGTHACNKVSNLVTKVSDLITKVGVSKTVFYQHHHPY
jgi:hypothetical protein